MTKQTKHKSNLAARLAVRRIYMTGAQYRYALFRLGINQTEAADLLGISVRASHGYAVDEHRVPEGVAKLLRLMVRLNLKPEDVK